MQQRRCANFGELRLEGEHAAWHRHHPCLAQASEGKGLVARATADSLAHDVVALDTKACRLGGLVTKIGEAMLRVCIALLQQTCKSGFL